MSKVKQLFNETFVYGLSSIFVRAINFLLLPFYTRILSPDDYGVLNIINTTFSIVWLLAVMALDSAAFVYFHDKPEGNLRKSIFASWFWSQFGVSVLFASILFGFSGLLSTAFFGT
ncbi:MAG: oligosaccharide flippase family protein [Chitinophagaceae bacterium]|nr:oligosaccharide flippase family protein [Chitinophagaceae bacterium]